MDSITAATFSDILMQAVDRWPDDDAVVFPETRHTYREVLEEATHVARGLLALGVRRGDHVGILMPNSPRFVFAFWGITLIGGVIVPINTRYRRKELGYVIENADIVTLLTSDLIAEHVDFVELLHDSLPGLADADPANLELADAGQLNSIVLFGTRKASGMIDEARFDAAARTVQPDAVGRERSGTASEDIALMPYTSGTTANPKGCLLSHRAMISDWAAVSGRQELGEGDAYWAPCPMFHNATMGPMLASFMRGAALLSMIHFEPGAGIDMIESEGATHLFGAFPTITLAMVHHPEYEPDRFASVRVAINVAPPDLLRQMQALTPHTTQVSAFGLTEGAGTSTWGRLTDTLDQRTETSGHPIEGSEVQIVDPETGSEQPVGEPGEILIRGTNTFSGYYRDPERTRETIEPDGWVHTGDLGRFDAEGRLAYVGRLKDMLKVGGENVAPTEIESHLSTHPAVALAQVVAKRDDTYGEVPFAFIELTPGHTASEREIIDHCVGQIASFKVPRGVRFVTEWPMSATKIQKFRLNEMLED